MKKRYLSLLLIAVKLFVSIPVVVAHNNGPIDGQSGQKTLEKPVNQGIKAVFQAPACNNQNWTKYNDPKFWNEPYWWDAAFSQHDLCEQTVELCLNVVDTCAGLHISCLLFMDLDGNDSLETVLSSAQMGAGGLGWNNIRFNNINTPNYEGGEARTFDEHSIASNYRYGFALQEITTDSGRIACLRFNTEAMPNTYVPIQLPHGKYKIVWTVSDSCGNNEEYAYAFSVKDCKAPELYCITTPIKVNIMPNGLSTLWALDFLQSTYDNCSPYDYMVER